MRVLVRCNDCGQYMFVLDGWLEGRKPGDILCRNCQDGLGTSNQLYESKTDRRFLIKTRFGK